MIRQLVLVPAIVVAALAPVAAQTAARAVELADYYRVEAINGTALSPDGRTIAFVRTFIVESREPAPQRDLDRRLPTAPPRPGV